MPGLTQRAYYDELAAIAAAAGTRAAATWSRVDPRAIAPSWRELLPELLAAVALAQRRAATLGGQGALVVVDELEATAQPDAFAGRAADGRTLPSLLNLPTLTALAGVAQGLGQAAALLGARAQLVQAVRSEVADAGREAAHAVLVADPRFTGWERYLQPPSCDRCILLAGRFYRWSTGFERHPRCDCQHRYVTRDEWRDGDPQNTPERVLAAMTDRQKRQAGFTAGDLAAIADGADVHQVVNARRGMSTVTAFGRQLEVTTEGTTRRGAAGRAAEAAGAQLTRTTGSNYNLLSAARLRSSPRPTPAEIYRISDDRDEARRLLRRYAYVLD